MPPLFALLIAVTLYLVVGILVVSRGMSYARRNMLHDEGMFVLTNMSQRSLSVIIPKALAVLLWFFIVIGILAYLGVNALRSTPEPRIA